MKVLSRNLRGVGGNSKLLPLRILIEIVNPYMLFFQEKTLSSERVCSTLGNLKKY